MRIIQHADPALFEVIYPVRPTPPPPLPVHGPTALGFF